jgi:hypothetical protein
MKTLNRSQIKEGLTQIPMETILNVSDKALTGKQKAFAREVAMGQTGAEAYRRSYGSKGKPKTVANKASALKKRGDVQATIKAYEAAIQASAYQTPAGLRALVIQTLVNVLVDEEAGDSVKIAAAKTLGTVTEVAAFTERKEVRTITSSEDTKAKLMAKLRDMMKRDAIDAPVIEVDSLLEELKPKTPEVETHPYPTPQADETESHPQLHTMSHERSQNFSNQADPTPLIQEDPPVGDGK